MSLSSHTKAVVFDLGGVIINLDKEASFRAFAQLASRPVDWDWGVMVHGHGFFSQLEVGAISPAQFYQHLREALECDATDEQLQRAWNAMLLDIPARRLRAIEGLAGRYDLYVLSNTNEVHVPAFEAQLAEVSGRSRFWDLFAGVVYSNQVGLRKPDEAIYAHVEQVSGLQPQQLYFIDDTEVNVVVARRRGWEADHLKGELLDLPLFSA